jgi:1,4-dihydroxy-2-naphthoyl-CoA hydrolase
MNAMDADSGGFNLLLGTEFLETGPDRATARIAVRAELLQPHGAVHGGVMASLAESVCSRATWLAVRNEGLVALGQSNEVSFLRPVSDGHLNAVARARHRGRTTWVWDVEISDDEKRVCALARLTIAVRPSRETDS